MSETKGKITFILNENILKHKIMSLNHFFSNQKFKIQAHSVYFNVKHRRQQIFKFEQQDLENILHFLCKNGHK